MATKLRRTPNIAPEDDSYDARGSLLRYSFADTRVRAINVSAIKNEPAALRPLADHPELDSVGLTKVEGVDLSPLEGLPLEWLSLERCSGLDLTPLAALAELDTLTLNGLGAITVPERLELSPKLRMLILVADGRNELTASVESLIRSVAWERLPHLEGLTIRVGFDSPGWPAKVDLNFLRHLTGLTGLDIVRGVHHTATSPSPLQSPFDGLPRSLRGVRVDADDPERTRDELSDYLGLPRWPTEGAPSVKPRD